MNNIQAFFFADKPCLYRNAAVVLPLLGLLWVGVVLAREIWHFISGIRAYLLAPYLGLGRINLAKYGSWAVVTGASEGIGRGYALELAKQGLNVVLMSRSQEKLQKVASKIREEHKRETLVIPVDFSCGYDIYEQLTEQLQGLDIGVLVNNVGMFYEHFEFLGNVPAERLYRVAQVNCQPVVQMTSMVLPGMLKKKQGVIINLSSIASVTAAPLMNIYSASKIFTNYVSDGIRKEHDTSGIIIQNVSPHFVSTKLTRFKPTSLFTPSVLTYVRSALATVGIQNNTFGYLPHAIQGYVITHMPSFMLDSVLWRTALAGRKKATNKLK